MIKPLPYSAQTCSQLGFIIKSYIMSKFTFIIMLGVIFQFSCSSIDEEILPAVGIYRAHVVGVAGPFDLIVSTDRSDNVVIEALYDGLEYYTVNADLDVGSSDKMDINIDDQQIAVGKNLTGTGFILNGTLEISYTMKYEGKTFKYKIVGTKI